MLQEAILGVIASYKSYVSLSRIYKEDNSKLKGKPNFPRFKNNNSIQEIIFTKYAIRVEKNILKLSISKKIQEKYKVKSLNFLIPRKLRKLVDFSKIKMIKIKQEKEKIQKAELKTGHTEYKFMKEIEKMLSFSEMRCSY